MAVVAAAVVVQGHGTAAVAVVAAVQGVEPDNKNGIRGGVIV